MTEKLTKIDDETLKIETTVTQEYSKDALLAEKAEIEATIAHCQEHLDKVSARLDVLR